MNGVMSQITLVVCCWSLRCYTRDCIISLALIITPTARDITLLRYVITLKTAVIDVIVGDIASTRRRALRCCYHVNIIYRVVTLGLVGHWHEHAIPHWRIDERHAGEIHWRHIIVMSHATTVTRYEHGYWLRRLLVRSPRRQEHHATNGRYEYSRLQSIIVIPYAVNTRHQSIIRWRIRSTIESLLYIMFIIFVAVVTTFDTPSYAVTAGYCYPAL